MRNTILIIACIFSLRTAAQYEQQNKPTQFDKFINLPGIEWAAYNYDTIRFDKINFNKLLVLRFTKNEIKTTLPILRTDHIDYLDKKSIDKERLYQQGDPLPLIDSAGNIIANTIKENPQFVDTTPLTITDITQILYIENKTLKSYVPWVSPAILPITTSSGIYLGTAEYFSSCFNFTYNYQSAKQNKISFLSGTKRKIYPDTADVENKVKELYGRNIIETLWPYILQGNIKAYSFDKNKELKPKHITDNLINIAKPAVPVYDPNGNTSAYFVPSESLSPKIFTAIELSQDWYYDHTKNIVFNRIREALLYAKKWTSDVQDKEASPILKIVFN
jgi:hypothetical protein